jgi:hypothetical protein
MVPEGWFVLLRTRATGHSIVQVELMVEDMILFSLEGEGKV